MNQEFQNNVREHNLASVRMMLTNELLLDPRGITFEEMLQYAKDRLPDLFEAEQPSRFSIPADKAEWNDDVLSKMKRDINMNFSVEKLALFVEMAKYVGADKACELERRDIEQKRRAEEEKESEKRKQRTRNSRKTTGTIVTGSGAVIGITGLCIEGTIGTVLSILGGVVAIGGVILLSVPNKTKR